MQFYVTDECSCAYCPQCALFCNNGAKLKLLKSVLPVGNELYLKCAMSNA